MGLPEVVFRPAVSVGRTQFNTFASDNITVSGNWEKQILPKLVGNLNYSLEQFRQFNVPYTDDLNAKVGSITPKLTLDLRDNSLVPTSGIFLTTSCDFADPSIGSQSDISYIRPQFRGDWYLNLVRDIVFSFSFRTGYEVGQKIPLIKLFMLGGVASVKGYQELEVNLNNVYPTLPGPNGTSVQTLSGDGSLVGHSLSFVNYRTQLDLPFAGPIKFGLFLDAANFLLDSYSFEPQFFGVGAGLHFQSPIGPVNGDVGFPIKALSGTGKNGYVLHFSVGIL